MTYRASIVLTSNKTSLDVVTSLKSLFEPNLNDQVEFLVNIERISREQVSQIREIGIRNLVLSDQVGSIATTLNSLIKASRGELIFRADDDDVYINRRLENQLLFMSNNPEIDFSGAALYRSEKGRITSIKFYPTTPDESFIASFFDCHTVAHPLVCGRREAFSRLLYRNEAAEDYDLWVRALNEGLSFANISVPMIVYRMPSYTSDKIAKLRQSVLDSTANLIEGSLGVNKTVAKYIAMIVSQQNNHRLTSSEIAAAHSVFIGRLMAKGYGIRLIERVVKSFHPFLHQQLFPREGFHT